MAQVRVLVVEFDGGVRDSVRDSVRDVLAEAMGRYQVTSVSTTELALGFLARWPEGVVVVCSNRHADHHLTAAFFAAVAADAQIAARHQYILLSSDPSLIPTELYLRLRQLHASIVRKPVDVDILLATVSEAATRLTRQTLRPARGAGGTSTAASPDQNSPPSPA